MSRTDTDASPRPSPTDGHKQLRMFVGEWNVAGRQLDSQVGHAAEIAGTERFEWLEGGFFLVHHFDTRVGGVPALCIEVTGFDPATGAYSTHTFYNNGQQAQWRMVERDGIWTLTGEWPMPDGPAQVRCTIEFGDEGNSRTGIRESSVDGSRWVRFWEVKSTRA